MMGAGDVRTRIIVVFGIAAVLPLMTLLRPGTSECTQGPCPEGWWIRGIVLELFG
jgi:hypothetical protein